MKTREETQHRKTPVGIFGESCFWLLKERTRRAEGFTQTSLVRLSRRAWGGGGGVTLVQGRDGDVSEAAGISSSSWGSYSLPLHPWCSRPDAF